MSNAFYNSLQFADVLDPRVLIPQSLIQQDFLFALALKNEEHSNWLCEKILQQQEQPTQFINKKYQLHKNILDSAVQY